MYASVGIPIIFLLLFNVAQTVREGITWLWSWGRQRRQIGDPALITPSPSTYDPNRQSVHSIEAGSSREVPSAVRKDLASIVHPPRVSLLENALPHSRPGSASVASQDPLGQQHNASSSQETAFQQGTVVPEETIKKPLVNSSDKSSSNSSPISNLIKSVPLPSQSVPSFLVNRNLVRQTLEREHFGGPKDTVPWFFISLFPTFYLLMGTILLSLTQNLNSVSALFVIGSNLLSLDHGGLLSGRTLLSSEVATFFYSLLVLIGVTFMLIFTLGMWPKITSSLEEAGRNLSVVKQINLYR